MVNNPGFRLALLTANGECPRWLWESLQSALAHRRADLVLVAGFSDLPQHSYPWIVEKYSAWERRRCLAADGLLREIDVAAATGKFVAPLTSSDPTKLVASLAISRADVLLVTPAADQAGLDGVAVPVWKVQFGTSPPQHRFPGLWEVVDRSLSSVSLVETVPALGSTRVLESIVARTDPRSWIRNHAGLAAKASDLLRRWIPPMAARKERPLLEIPALTAALQTDNWQAHLAILRLLRRFGNHAIGSSMNLDQWQLAVDRTPEFSRLANPQILTPPPDRFWCDPFLFEKDGDLHVFIEEYLYRSGKGHIAVLSRSSSGEWLDPVIAMERPYHLSYPFVFEHKGELLMLPETTAIDRVELWRCLRFPDRWELDTVLMENIAGADATLWYQDERWWLFLDVRDELCIFYADSLRGAWLPHPLNPVKSDSRNGRPAGRIFRNRQDVIRPAQDCSLQYGREVVFNKITRLTVRDFEEVEVGRLHTPWNGNTGCHTFNQIGDITVVDRLVQRRKLHWNLRSPGRKVQVGT